LFFRFGRVQSVKILGKKNDDGPDCIGGAATVAFMDIKSANIAFNAEHKFEDRVLRTDYYDPSAFEGGGSVQTSTSLATSASSVGLNSSRLHTEETPSVTPSIGGVQNRLLSEDSSVRSSHGGYSGVREFGYRTPGSRYPEDGYNTPRQRLVRPTGYRTQGGYSQEK
jgi:hypothetical protein